MSTTPGTARPQPQVTPSASASARVQARAPSISPEARRSYAKHLATGRALAAEKKWGEASTELEKALVDVPGDARALTELSWAQLQAGDVPKARKTSKKAVQRARDPKTKASALYNLGRAEEASGKRDDAAKHYAASLKLRPNDTVQKQLDALVKPASPSASASAQPAEAPLPCTASQQLDEVTTCIGKAARVADDDDAVDTRAPELLPAEGDMLALGKRVRLVRTNTTRFEDELFLVASSMRGWSVVARLGGTYNPGAFGINEELTVAKAEVRRVKGASVLWLETLHGRSDSDMGVDEVETVARRDVTICLLADEKRKETVCPISRPLSFEYRRERMGLSDIDEETKKLQTPGLPIARETTFAVTLDDEGAVVTRLVTGVAEEEDRKKLGTARLF